MYRPIACDYRLNDKQQGPLQFAVTRVSADGHVTVVGTNVVSTQAIF